MKTDISVLLDRSGSMATIVDDTIGGFNTFVTEQRAIPGAAVLTLVQFDGQGYDRVVDAQSLAEVQPLTRETFVPRGNTPLLDAMGRLISETGDRIKAMPEAERPNNVVCVIITDGAENASSKYTSAQINDMVTHQSDVYKWAFVYLGANHDAITSAAQMGIPMAAAATYTANNAGTRAAYAGASNLVAQARAGKRPTLSVSARAAMRPNLPR